RLPLLFPDLVAQLRVVDPPAGGPAVEEKRGGLEAAGVLERARVPTPGEADPAYGRRAGATYLESRDVDALPMPGRIPGERCAVNPCRGIPGSLEGVGLLDRRARRGRIHRRRCLACQQGE